MAIRDWMGRHRLRRLERRGDVVLHWTDKAQALLSLGQDLIPERELLRNFYGLLVYAGAGLAGLRRQTSAPQGDLRWLATQRGRPHQLRAPPAIAKPASTN